MVDFSKLKKTSDISRLTKEIERMNSSGNEDNRLWTPEVDAAGNGYAVIRFLPAPEVDGDEGLPWILLFTHGFKGPSGKWYIEKSLTTLGEKDPVSEYNNKLWNSTDSDDSPARKQARDQKRKKTYYSNIYVVSDPKRPENEGKVFLYRYGPKIFEKIYSVMHPAYEHDTPMNPFDFWNGADFEIRIKKKAGYQNYDDSRFRTPAPLSDDDEQLEAIWKSEYSLREFISPKNFKSYDELKKQMEEVLELNKASVKPARPVEKQVRPEDDSGGEAPPWNESSTVIDDDDDDPLARFRSLVDD